ncbi:ribbon-helix-helix protein, CopG family [Methanobacterium sp.]|uniref:ribbon-helix-helix protein, CopG family n=1 Tax=Methanobacterium sp. TaxID=2164 RepID=UPI0025D8D0C4|nr:ribbon-helix-helix protein, CopG family [Methanobacterium sp.]MBI5458614.1 ribbon-helix-helix protein, CopG family [Methanobacterium sp.]
MPETLKRGRPKSKNKMEQITIKLPPKIIEELKKLSEKTYNPVSFHIRQAIAEYLDKNK